MKLILTLLVLLTGFAGGDVARATPTPSAPIGFAITLAEAVVEARVAQAAHRPAAIQPRYLMPASLLSPRAMAEEPVLSALHPRGLRIRE